MLERIGTCRFLESGDKSLESQHNKQRGPVNGFGDTNINIHERLYFFPELRMPRQCNRGAMPPFHSIPAWEKKGSIGRRMSVATCTPNSTLLNEQVTRQLGVKWTRQCVVPGR